MTTEAINDNSQMEANKIYDAAVEHARQILPKGFKVLEPDALDYEGGYYKIEREGNAQHLIVGLTVHRSLLKVSDSYYVNSVAGMFDKQLKEVTPSSEFRPLTQEQQQQQWSEDGEDFNWTLPDHPWLIFRLPIFKHLPRLPFIRSLRAQRLQRMRFDHEGCYADRVTEEEFTYDLWVIHGIEKGRA